MGNRKKEESSTSQRTFRLQQQKETDRHILNYAFKFAFSSNIVGRWSENTVKIDIRNIDS